MAIVVAVLLGAFALAFVLYPLYQKEFPSMNRDPAIMSFDDQDRSGGVTLSEAKGLSRWAQRCFAALSMTVPVVGVKFQKRGATARRVEHAASLLPGDITAQQADREESARSALQEVEFDFQLGNLGEDDYRSLRERYMRRALSALKSRHDRERELDDAIEEQVRKLRETES